MVSSIGFDWGRHECPRNRAGALSGAQQRLRVFCFHGGRCGPWCFLLEDMKKDCALCGDVMKMLGA